MADVMEHFFRGQAAGQAEAAHEQALGENKLRTLILKHEIARMSIEDQLRGREVAAHTLEMLHGQPNADLPQETVTPASPQLQPSASFAGAATPIASVEDGVGAGMRAARGLPDVVGPQQQPGTMLAPNAQAPAGVNPAVTRPKTVAIPGVKGDGIDIPALSLRPRSLEDLLTAQRLAERQKLREVPEGGIVGSVDEGPLLRGEEKEKIIPAGATLMRGNVVIARGAPRASALRIGKPGDVIINPDGTREVIPGKSDAETSREETRLFREYQSAISVLQKQHNDEFKTYTEKSKSPDVLMDPTKLGDAPVFQPPTYEEWKATHASAGAADVKPGGGKTVTAKDLATIAQQRGTTVEAERRRYTQGGYRVAD